MRGWTNHLRKLASDSGTLGSVRGNREASARYSSLAFEFSNGTLILSCDGNTDEIVATVEQRPPGEMPTIEDPDLDGLAGMVIEYAWTMENHRGYHDAFQLRLLNLETRDEQTRQFEAAASTLSVSRVTR